MKSNPDTLNSTLSILNYLIVLQIFIIGNFIFIVDNQQQFTQPFMEKDIFDITKQQIDKIDPAKCLNINVGVLGHVDSGKTSICRILSQITSTASLDKHPQSQERGITLDLGFSAFQSRIPEFLQVKVKQQWLQFTLVDCPGHASLLRTIIGGAQIIDMMFLVIDIAKGVQTQTAECIIIAELFIKNIIVVLNKVDLLQDQKQIQAKTNALRKVFSKTKFGADVTMVTYSTKENINQHKNKLKKILVDKIQVPQRKFNKNFLLLIDHAFRIKGKGAIITGTVVEGRIKPGQEIQICQVQQKGKIKSIEMFRKPLQSAKQGDRVAMLVTQIQSQKIQRGIACIPGSIKQISKFVIDLNLIRLYKKPIKNKTKFHIISGHQTVMGQIRLFYSPNKQFKVGQQYLLVNQVQQAQDFISKQKIQQKIQQIKIKEQHQKIQQVIQKEKGCSIYAIITLQKEMYASSGNHIIGYKFDIDQQEKTCRIAFHGSILHVVDEKNQATKIKLYKQKVKRGVVDRLVDNYTIIVKDLFGKQVNIGQFLGKEIAIEGQQQMGKIDGPFGKSGKIRVLFKNELTVPKIQGKEVQMKYIKWYH